MTTGPRETPHPIILHVDDQGNPVRLAEASSIYVTTVSAVSISATNYLGLSLTGVAVPQGVGTEIQFRRNSTQLGGDSSLTFDEGNQRLRATEIVVGDLSSTNTIYSEETITARLSVSSPSISSIDFKTQTLSATTISAITVCATNYNSLFDSLSFQNLDARYLNSSGDSVTGSFTVQNLSATTISATNWRGLPSSLATWNASSIQGIPVTSTPPSPLQTLIYKDGVWQPSSVAGVAGGIPGGNPLTIQFNNGIFSGVDSVKYSESISGLSLTTLSSTNLSSVNIRVTTISATTYENNGSGLPTWNAQKIQDVPVSKSGGLVHKDILAIDSGGTRFEKTGIDDYASWVYTSIKPTIHNELPQTNASALHGVTVTSTAPSLNNVLIYNGSFWTPSASVALGSIASNNLASINSSSTNLSAINARITGLSSTTLSSISARITELSATTISATDWQGLPSGIATWNASAIRGSNIIGVDPAVAGNVVGTFVYSPQNNSYYTLPFSSTLLTGNRIAADPLAQGQVVASYLGSAVSDFQINPAWITVGDTPSNNDVLVFKSDLYNINADYGLPATKAWTWVHPSTIVTPTTAAGPYEGFIQFRGLNGEFSSVPDLYYSPQYSSVRLPKDLYLDHPGSYLRSTYIDAVSGFNTKVIQVYNGGNFSGTFNFKNGTVYSENVSATTINTPYLKLFTKTTGTGQTPERLNQTITYDPTYQTWNPGYTIFQATGAPVTASGANGDIWFQYLP